MEKKIKICLAYVCLSFLLVFSFGLVFFLPTHIACADIFFETTVQDENCSMRMTANCRRKNVPLEEDIRKVHTEDNSTIEYHCFKWRDLESLSFNFTFSPDTNITSHKFVVTYLKSETLKSIFEGPHSQSETLYEAQSKTPYDFFYYVDSNLEERNTINSRSGHDFGLYKFDFKHTQTIDEKQVEISVGAIYVAVLPDNIDTINIPTNSQILYSIGSSNKLLNVFNLYFSSDSLKYVNPARLQWEVVGQDVDSVNYCLDKHMQEKMEYGNYQLIWQSYLPEESICGNNFKFDSNGIEGTWTVMLTIKNSDGSIKANFKVDGLSTIKVQKKSYLWLILLIVFLVILIVAIVILIIYLKRKKKEKVW